MDTRTDKVERAATGRSPTTPGARLHRAGGQGKRHGDRRPYFQADFPLAWPGRLSAVDGSMSRKSHADRCLSFCLTLLLLSCLGRGVRECRFVSFRVVGGFFLQSHGGKCKACGGLRVDAHTRTHARCVTWLPRLCETGCFVEGSTEHSTASAGEAAGVHHWARRRGEGVAPQWVSATFSKEAIGATTPSAAGILPVSRASRPPRRMAQSTGAQRRSGRP